MVDKNFKNIILNIKEKIKTTQVKTMLEVKKFNNVLPNYSSDLVNNYDIITIGGIK